VVNPSRTTGFVVGEAVAFGRVWATGGVWRRTSCNVVFGALATGISVGATGFAAGDLSWKALFGGNREE